jgi:hypothetical protein
MAINYIINILIILQILSTFPLWSEHNSAVLILQYIKHISQWNEAKYAVLILSLDFYFLENCYKIPIPVSSKNA